MARATCCDQRTHPRQYRAVSPQRDLPGRETPPPQQWRRPFRGCHRHPAHCIPDAHCRLRPRGGRPRQRWFAGFRGEQQRRARAAFSNNGGDVGNAKNAPSKNHWLAVRLIGTKSNRDGLGAALKVTAGDFVTYDQAKGGMSYCSSQGPRIYFGLAQHAKVDSAEITGPAEPWTRCATSTPTRSSPSKKAKASRLTTSQD